MKWLLIWWMLGYGGMGATSSAEFDDFVACDTARAALVRSWDEMLHGGQIGWASCWPSTSRVPEPA